MNRRMKKKAENIRRKKLHRILDQVIDINGLGARQAKLTGDKPTAFYWFNGHAGDLSVTVHSMGWYPGCNDSYSADSYFDGNKYGPSFDSVIRDLDELKERLNV